MLEKKVEETSHNVKNINSESSDEDREYTCKLCDFKCVKNTNLKVHLKEKYRKEIKCKVCHERFDETFKLEKHLKNHDVETFQCGKCEKTFHLKWRLEKHMKAHEMLNIKYCHYFNNKKTCPFEEVGCMYKHAKSGNCWFKDLCKNKLCQYTHDVKKDCK